MARLKLRSLALLTPPALVVLALGCRSILGIEAHEYDAVLASLNCENYCTQIMAQCAGPNTQYPDMKSCLGLCSTFTPGTPTDIEGDTIGCRLNVVMNIVENTDCPTAGPGGNGICGSSMCQTLCDQAAVVCPEDWDASVSDCLTACGELSTCPNPYSVLPDTNDEEVYPNDSSVACRLYHLSAASAGLPNTSGLETSAQAEHCPHVRGVMFCGADAGLCGDAGD